MKRQSEVIVEESGWEFDGENCITRRGLKHPPGFWLRWLDGHSTF